MPNKASKAGCVPIRTCVICKRKHEQRILIRFVLLNKKIVLDLFRKLPSRGYYVCNENHCIMELRKWLKKKIRRNK